METRPAHKRVWRSRRSGSIAQDGGPFFTATFPPITRSTATLSTKEHFHEARESLLGVWQTDNRSEHFVLMVRTAEEVVLGSPCGGIESGIACYDRVSCPTWAHVFRGVINGNPRLASVFEH
jgi:hypothetical protein